MRAVIQRVSSSSVVIDGETVASIGQGLLVLLGVERGDGSEDIAWLAPKVARMRIFPDEAGLLNQSVIDCHGELIVVSQFTLYGSTKKGNRPSFLRAGPPDMSEPLYLAFCDVLEKEIGKPVGRGRFGADMKVSLVNDGPVTIVIDTKNKE
ncbi:D-aminoacyl-tRNA deacylase [Luteolibacter luteus]|uniref:D-aminoacyl-tRNA deacylase n=1 Tax=Luteolibacter luteus TaxID=2728835 RepID=A0A858RNH4_9BACT|nr:D-aminoacyl-tRNA deacylase [Luteolibacter luteus]QJE98285.1 D-tyrosyl-tRNA(Tyr) deacylase [Luteolibacter luteus]